MDNPRPSGVEWRKQSVIGTAALRRDSNDLNPLECRPLTARIPEDYGNHNFVMAVESKRGLMTTGPSSGLPGDTRATAGRFAFWPIPARMLPAGGLTRASNPHEPFGSRLVSKRDISKDGYDQESSSIQQAIRICRRIAACALVS